MKPNTLEIKYDGTLGDLNSMLNSASKLFDRFSSHGTSIDKIKREIVPNFEKYKNERLIFVGNVLIKNKSQDAYGTIFYEKEKLILSDPPLYSWEFTKFILYLILIFIIIDVIIMVYCYFFELDPYGYITKLF